MNYSPYAGIGSQAKALKNIGADFEHYRICEFDKYAVQSYNAVHGTEFETSDITKITADDLGIVDTDKWCYVMTYSFPCQDLSNAGLGKGMAKGSGTRSGLLWEVERLLDELFDKGGQNALPQVLLMENVPAVIGAKNIQHFAKWQEKLESLGYKNKWEVLNAKGYGIPQNRERCFMVSILGDYFYDFPKKIPLKLRLKDMLEKEVDEKYICGYHNGKEWVMKSKNQHLANILHKIDLTKTQSLDTYNQSIHTNYVQSILSRIGNRNEDYVFNEGIIRSYTERECFSFMGFCKEDFEKASLICPRSQLYKQAGNSICVPVLEHIFRQML